MTNDIEQPIEFNAEGADAARIIARCRKGEQKAWDELVAKFQRLIISIPRRAGLSEEQAADVFQDVFLTLFQKLDEIEQPERIRSWFVTTAKFKTWSIVRSSKGTSAYATEEEMETELMSLPDGSPLADESLVKLEEQHLVRTAMEKLDERCQTILKMLYLADAAASYEYVAAEIGVGASSISPLRSRCLEKLRKLLF